jgi:predicted AlkP superfamily phosphohydrolase/phosphomutase
MLGAVPKPRRSAGWLGRLLDRISHIGRPRIETPVPEWLERSGVAWMPAARYGQFWPQMPAFALPAYYDGRVRINLRGREARGTVDADHYDRTCEEIIGLIRDCSNLLTGQPAVAEIHRPKKDPGAVGPSEADLYVVWKSAPLGLSTRHGNIGPVPYRRTGGHTGSRGFLYLRGEGISPGEDGALSSFDVIPTVVDLLGEAGPVGMSGMSAVAKLG